MLLNYQMPLILGSDFAGIVVSVGKMFKILGWAMQFTDEYPKIA